MIAIMALSQLQLIALLAVGAASAGVPIMGTKDAGAAPEPTEIAADKMKAVKEALAKDKGRGGWRGKMGDGWRGLAEKAKGAAGGAAQSRAGSRARGGDGAGCGSRMPLRTRSSRFQIRQARLPLCAWHICHVDASVDGAMAASAVSHAIAATVGGGGVI